MSMSEHDKQDGHIQNGHGDREHGDPDHIVSPKIYVVIFLTLLFFTALTIGASYLEMGPFNPIVAIAIAVTKATLVVLFFMHVKYSSRVTKLAVGAGVFTFLVLVGMTLSDYISRAWGRW
jgi:cytochrome c oxidase subunit 4